MEMEAVSLLKDFYEQENPSGSLLKHFCVFIFSPRGEAKEERRVDLQAGVS